MIHNFMLILIEESTINLAFRVNTMLLLFVGDEGLGLTIHLASEENV